MSALEGLISIVAEFVDGIGGWLRPRRQLQRGQLLRAQLPVLLGGDAGEKGHFLTTLPKGAVVRVERVAGGDTLTCWVTPVDERVRLAIIPEHLRGIVSSYELEIGAEDRRERFEPIRS